MLNVVEFRANTSLALVSGPDEDTSFDISEAIRLADLYRQHAKREIERGILMLNLAADKALIIAEGIAEPNCQRELYHQIDAIRRQLRTARQMAADL